MSFIYGSFYYYWNIFRNFRRPLYPLSLCLGLEISSNKGMVVIGGTGDATNETLLAAKEKVNGGGMLSEEEHNVGLF